MAAGYGGAALPLWEALWRRCRARAAVADLVSHPDIAAHLAQLAQLYHRASPTLEAVCAAVAPLPGGGAGEAAWSPAGSGSGPGSRGPLSGDPAAVAALARLHPLRLLVEEADRWVPGMGAPGSDAAALEQVQQPAASSELRGAALEGESGETGKHAGVLARQPPVDRAASDALLAQQARTVEDSWSLLMHVPGGLHMFNRSGACMKSTRSSQHVWFGCHMMCSAGGGGGRPCGCSGESPGVGAPHQRSGGCRVSK